MFFNKLTEVLQINLLGMNMEVLCVFSLVLDYYVYCTPRRVWTGISYQYFCFSQEYLPRQIIILKLRKFVSIPGMRQALVNVCMQSVWSVCADMELDAVFVNAGLLNMIVKHDLHNVITQRNIQWSYKRDKTRKKRGSNRRKLQKMSWM